MPYEIIRTLNDGVAPVHYREEVLGGAGIPLDVTIPDGAVDQPFTFGFLKAKLKAIFIVSDQHVKVCTNAPSSADPQDTINLAKGRAFEWSHTDPLVPVPPFRGDVTSLFLSNASGKPANVKIRGVVDPTK